MQGILTKTYGGAELCPQTKVEPSPLNSRRMVLHNEKEAIAAKAAEFIKSNSTLALDAGSTVFELCPFINEHDNLIVICSDSNTSSSLLANRSNKIYMMGGFLTADGTSSGTFAKDFFNSMTRVDIFFFSTDGASVEDGLSSDESGINELKKRYLKNSAIKVALVDHSKFMHRGFYKTCSYESIDYVITDSKTPSDIVERIRRLGTEVIVVDVN